MNGRTTKEVVKANIEEIILDKQVLADEWLAHYQYWSTAQGIREMVADILKQVSLQRSAVR
jgi:hypothetical protein